MRIYDGTRYLTMFGSKKYEAIYNRIRYLISLKSGITYFFSLLCKNQSYAAKKPIKFFDVNVDNIVISKSVKTETSSKY